MNAIPHSLQTHAPDEVAADPSMEEILASIRRIIADDQNTPPAPPTAVPPRSAPAPAPRAMAHARLSHEDARTSVFASYDEEPRRPQRPAAPQPPRERGVVPASRPVVEPPQPLMERRPEPPRAPAPQRSHEAPRWPEPQAYEPRRQPEPQRAIEPQRVAEPARRQEIEPVRDTEVVRAQDAESALLSANADASIASSFQALAQSMLFQNSDMMGEAVREMMRPMLKQWLDDNLPVLVERLVRAEIERVARGGR